MSWKRRFRSPTTTTTTASKVRPDGKIWDDTICRPSHPNRLVFPPPPSLFSPELLPGNSVNKNRQDEKCTGLCVCVHHQLLLLLDWPSFPHWEMNANNNNNNKQKPIETGQQIDDRDPSPTKSKS
jgi:hypothetical protein